MHNYISLIHSGYVVSKTKKIQRLSKIFSAYCQRLFKDFESNQLSKNCECKHHFYPVISPVKSHPKMHLFVDICENLLQSIILLARKSYNQILTKEFKDFFRLSSLFHTDFSKTLKDLNSNLKTFKDFKDRYVGLRTLSVIDLIARITTLKPLSLYTACMLSYQSRGQSYLRKYALP